MTGDLDVRWIDGSPSAKHDRDPEIQVHRYDEHTVILRQNMSVHYEAPFLYLLLGNDKAVLVDSGATPQLGFFPLRETVDRLLAGWLAEHPCDHYQLVVAHSHSHGDHTAGDVQFADRPDTTVLGADLAAVTGFFGLPDWPEGTAQLDLGGRVIDVIPSPGHDSRGQLLRPQHRAAAHRRYDLPGAAVCEGLGGVRRHDGPAVGLRQGHPVHHVLGGHIEMTRRPGVDYPIRTSYQPQGPPWRWSRRPAGAAPGGHGGR